jgi:hypothetical protein
MESQLQDFTIKVMDFLYFVQGENYLMGNLMRNFFEERLVKAFSARLWIG